MIVTRRTRRLDGDGQIRDINVLETGFDLFEMDVDGIITKEEFNGPLPTCDVIDAYGDGLLLQQRLMRVRITRRVIQEEYNADFNIIDTDKLGITPESREMIERCMAQRSVEQSRAHRGYSRVICENRMVKLAYEAVGMARQSAEQTRVCAEEHKEEHRQLRRTVVAHRLPSETRRLVEEHDHTHRRDLLSGEDQQALQTVEPWLSVADKTTVATVQGGLVGLRRRQGRSKELNKMQRSGTL